MSKNIIKAREHEFLEFAIQNEVLRFGKFTLKSGRISPYFFNAGLFNTGTLLGRLARFYAASINEAEPHDFMLFGPAYKGIPIAAATATALAEIHGRNVPFAFNRKEIKNHGEGGRIVGAKLSGRVVIIDDVITAGGSVREAVDIIKSKDAEPVSLAIALDREEKITDAGRSTTQDIRERMGLKVHAITSLSKLIEYLRTIPHLRSKAKYLEDYRDHYGAENK
jgi:orotate phosphoribosyltransferase